MNDIKRIKLQKRKKIKYISKEKKYFCTDKKEGDI